MIQRTSKSFIEKILSDNPKWKVLDIGCGYSANPHATTICDIQDFSKYYKNKTFVKITEKNLPFKDKEFDFVVASHVAEHVKDVTYFLNELSRVSKQGYIEVPTRLEDNLVFENKNDHLWHFVFDDVKKKIIISNKVQYFQPILTVSSIKSLNNFFKESLVLELHWDNSIEYSIIKNDLKPSHNISILKLFKKYISKKVRQLIK